MGILCCTSVDKEGDLPEGKAQIITHSYVPHRLQKIKMPQFTVKPDVVGSRHVYQTAVESGDFETQTAYDRAREALYEAERARAFDAQVFASASSIEDEAVRIVKNIRTYDLKNTYGASFDEAHGLTTGQRAAGQHFLGSVDLVNKTRLIEVAKRIPKGSHLHIHFNSCLPAQFLIRQARNIDAMYIRSTIPLTTQKDMAKARISFMVLTLDEATHVKAKDGSQTYVPLGNVWSSSYISNTWMPYKEFQRTFKFQDSNGAILEGTHGAETWLERKVQISEEEAHACDQTGHGIWAKFNFRTQMLKGLFVYESAFRNYTRACIKDFVKDNIQYAEIRPNFMAANSLKTDDGTRSIGNDGTLKIIDEVLKSTMEEIRQEGGYFGGLKVIYCTPRSFSKQLIEQALNECITLKQKYPDLVCGFDLVGHEEMGNELYHFVPEFLAFRQKCKTLNLDIPFLFHCGETLDVGTKVDGNLFDAILLNSKRIGHGYALARHPLLMEIFKEKNIAVESCPISNEVLGLTPVMAGHHLPILLANNVPCTINSDNATFYRSSLSHDFYQVMIGSESMTLLGWKQLAKWSLEHSCMNPIELAAVTAEWTRRWDEFCRWIVDEYGAEFSVDNSEEC